MRKIVPNVITTANLFFGICSILMTTNGHFSMSLFMIFLAVLFDGVDGKVARALHVDGEFGKELDSLSDVISFGLAPAFLMYAVSFSDLHYIGWLCTSFFPICGALRLARFNTLTSDQDIFIGLPIPAAGSMLALLATMHDYLPSWFLVFASLGLSFFMVSKIKYPSFKYLHQPKIWFVSGLSLLIISYLTWLWFPSIFAKMLLLPLVFYTFLGLKKR